MPKLLLILLFTLPMYGFSQNSDFTLSLILPEPSQKLSAIQINTLENKLTNLINKSEVATIGFNNDFVIYPLVNIYDIGIVQGGLENLTVISLDLTLNIKQISSSKSFNSISKRIKGSGKTEELAVANALTLIKVNDKNLVDFIAKAKTNIYNYYNENCSNIINKANKLYTNYDYEQSISLLNSIPEIGNNCAAKAGELALQYYKVYQTKLCKQNIAKAKSEIILKNYENALSLLNQIDENSTCYADVENLMKQIVNNIDKAEKIELDLEHKRINAIKEIAKAYYSNTIRSVNYNVLVK